MAVNQHVHRRKWMVTKGGARQVGERVVLGKKWELKNEVKRRQIGFQ